MLFRHRATQGVMRLGQLDPDIARTISQSNEVVPTHLTLSQVLALQTILLPYVVAHGEVDLQRFFFYVAEHNRGEVIPDENVSYFVSLVGMDGDGAAVRKGGDRHNKVVELQLVSYDFWFIKPMAGPGATVVLYALPGPVRQEGRSGVEDVHAMPGPAKEWMFAVDQIYPDVLGMGNLLSTGTFEFDSNHLHHAVDQLAPLDVAQFVHDLKFENGTPVELINESSRLGPLVLVDRTLVFLVPQNGNGNRTRSDGRGQSLTSLAVEVVLIMIVVRLLILEAHGIAEDEVGVGLHAVDLAEQDGGAHPREKQASERLSRAQEDDERALTGRGVAEIAGR